MGSSRQLRTVAWGREEAAAAKLLRPALRQGTRLCRQVLGLLDDIARDVCDSAEQIPRPHLNVQLRLLSAAAKASRAIEHVALAGYPLQALGLCASIYELCHAVAFIGTDDSRATKWESHRDFRRSYPSTADRAKGARAMLMSLGATPAEANTDVWQQEENYKLFCMAKHGNPTVLQNYDTASAENRLRIFFGPSARAEAVVIGRQALYHNAALMLGATLTLWKPFVPSKTEHGRRTVLRAKRSTGAMLAFKDTL